VHPFSPAVKRCPYPYYDRWRDESAVPWNASIGAWLVTGFDEAAFVFDHCETFSSRNAVSGPSAQDGEGFPSLMTTDQPRHNHLRALVARAFAPVPIEDERGARIRDVFAEQLDGIRGSRPVEGGYLPPRPGYTPSLWLGPSDLHNRGQVPRVGCTARREDSCPHSSSASRM
jgi:cytochrome P450